MSKPYNASPPPQSRSYFSVQSILLTFLSIILIFFLSHLERYEEWKEKLSDYWEQYQVQKEDLSVETRLKGYYANYEPLQMIKQQLLAQKQANHDTSKLLAVFQPVSYTKELNIGFQSPEPATFYYFTGLRATYLASPESANATYYVEIVKGGGLKISKIDSAAQIKEIKSQYKNYPPYE